MVVLSGSKGLMFFETEALMIAQKDTTLIAQTVHSIRTVAETIRLGDIGAVGFTVSSQLNEQVMVETILRPATGPSSAAQLLVAVVNTDASGYSNLLCHVDVNKHWTFKKHTIARLALHLGSAPQLAGLSNWREAVGDKLVPLTGATVTTNGTDVVLSQIALDDQLVARWLVADAELQ